MNRRNFIASSLLLALTRPSIASITAISSDSSDTKTSSDFGQRNQTPVISEESGPIVLTAENANQKISGLHFKDITEAGSYAIHIIGNSSGELLNIEITDCLFENVRWAIRIDNGAGITINGNRFSNVGQGIRVINGESIKIEQNEFEQIGALQILNYGYGQFWAQNVVQFINVTGNGNSISGNLVDNAGYDTPFLEDAFSLWNSGGMPSSWTRINSNKLRGSDSGSTTGAAILVGDAVGAKELYASHIEINSNTISRMQSLGIGIAGGNQYRISGNRVYLPLDHSRNLAQHPFNQEHNSRPGAGITIYDYSRTLACDAVDVTDNEAYAVRADNVANAFWASHETCSNIQEHGNTWHWDIADSGSVGDHMLPQSLFVGVDSRYFSVRRNT